MSTGSCYGNYLQYLADAFLSKPTYRGGFEPCLLKVEVSEGLLKKSDAEIILLHKQLASVQEDLKESSSRAREQVDLAAIFRQKYAAALEKVQQRQGQRDGLEEQLRCCQQQVLDTWRHTPGTPETHTRYTWRETHQVHLERHTMYTWRETPGTPGETHQVHLERHTIHTWRETPGTHGERHAAYLERQTRYTWGDKHETQTERQTGCTRRQTRCTK